MAAALFGESCLKGAGCLWGGIYGFSWVCSSLWATVGSVCRVRAAEPLWAPSCAVSPSWGGGGSTRGTARVKEQVLLHGPAVSFCTQDGWLPGKISQFCAEGGDCLRASALFVTGPGRCGDGAAQRGFNRGIWESSSGIFVNGVGLLLFFILSVGGSILEQVFNIPSKTTT